MSKDRTLKKKEVVQFTAKLLNAFRHLFSDYERATRFEYHNVKVGEWALETSMLGQTTIQSILKITSIDEKTGSYKGVDLLGEEQSWGNASFTRLPKSCQDYLNGEYKW